MCIDNEEVSETLAEIEMLVDESRELTESNLYLYIKGGVLNALPITMQGRENIAEIVANTALAHFRMGAMWQERNGYWGR